LWLKMVGVSDVDKRPAGTRVDSALGEIPT
jgi:hypothetical protein